MSMTQSAQLAQSAKLAGTTKAQLEAEMHMSAETFWERLGFRPGSAQSTVITLVARLTFYALGAVSALYAVAFLSAVLQTWGVPLFFVMVFEIVTMLIGMLASWKASDTIVDFIADGGVSRTIDRSASWVKGRFKRASTTVKSYMTSTPDTVQ